MNWWNDNFGRTFVFSRIFSAFRRFNFNSRRNGLNNTWIHSWRLKKFNSKSIKFRIFSLISPRYRKLRKKSEKYFKKPQKKTMITLQILPKFRIHIQVTTVSSRIKDDLEYKTRNLKIRISSYTNIIFLTTLNKYKSDFFLSNFNIRPS